MVTFDGQALFSSGPHDLRVGATALRHERTHSPRQDGTTLHVDGQTARDLRQVGWLIADSQVELDALVAGIEALIDGCEHTLVFNGRDFEHVVMVVFTPGPVRRIGPRVGMKYETRYVQLQR